MRVNDVAAGAFRSFSDARRERGYALDRRNMPRMNATDDEIATCSRAGG